MKLTEAIAQLDHAQDAHWTEDGMPSVEAVAAIYGKEVTREQITKAAPDLVRKAKEPSAEEQAAEAQRLADEQAAAEPQDGDPEIELPQGEEARAIVNAHDNELSDLDAQMDALRKKRDEVQKSRDKILTETDAGQNTPHAQLVQDYFASQDKARMEQIEHMNAAKVILGKSVGQAGAGPSQLDQAMAGQRGHGLKRPAFTPPAGGAK
jgi:hypothetical protein